MELPQFLARAAATAFAYGAFDCGLWQADWLVACGYPDPAAHLRGRYATLLGCQRIVRRHGGMAGVVEDCARRARLQVTASPQVGDVGLVEVGTDRGLEAAGGICTGTRWAVLGVAGLIVAPMTPIKAWSVSCRRP